MRPRFFAIIIFVLSVFVGIGFFQSVQHVFAQSASLDDLLDLIDNDEDLHTGTNHGVAFTLPRNSLSISTTDYIQVNLPNFSDVTIATSISGEYSGTPVITLDGNIIKITGIFVLPGKRLTISGITATNPVGTSNYNVIVTVTSDQAGALIKNYASTTATTNPGTITVSAEIPVAQAIIRISGFAAPETFVSFTEGENVIGTDLTGPTGVFSKYFPAMEPGDHSISLYGVDSSNRSTSVVPLTINAPAYQTTTVSNILLSPTASISDTEIEQGEDLYATGSAYPGTSITVFTDTPLRTYTASTSAAGVWTTTINDTSDYNPGDYRFYTLAQTGGGAQSLASQTLLFSIVSSSSTSSGVACGDISQGDLNCDDSINLTDFSILMYYWASANETADINSDDIVNLTDFSILMYYWGT